MTPTCSELEPLLAAQLVGELSGEEAARLEVHLGGCERCRAEAAAFGETIEAARLPPLSEAERVPLLRLDDQTLAAWQKQERRHRTLLRGAMGGLMALAAGLLMLVGTSRQPHRAALQRATATAEAPVTGGFSESAVEALADGPFGGTFDDLDEYASASDDPDAFLSPDAEGEMP